MKLAFCPPPPAIPSVRLARTSRETSVVWFSHRAVWLICSLIAIAAFTLLGPICQAQRTVFMKPPNDTPQRQAWRKAMKKVPLPSKGCFTASYPISTWKKVTCGTAPNIPYGSVGHAHPDDIGGNSNSDDLAITSGLISSAEGSFIEGTGITSVGYFTLQLNTNTFSTSVCDNAPDPGQCIGWEQFVYSVSGSQIFIQDWLIGWGRPCAPGWIAYQQADCYINGAATNVPGVPLAYLPYMTLKGEASSGVDTDIFAVPGYGVYAVSQDSVLGLDQQWDLAEFNVFGDGNGTEVYFNQGTTLVVQTSVNNGTTYIPACGDGTETAESNNLNLVQPCCPYGGNSPNIQFMESNVDGATATCGANALQGPFAAAPTNSSSYTTYGGWYPTIDFTETLYDDTPGANIYWQFTGCGNPSGGNPLSSGDSFYVEDDTSQCQYSSPEATMFATAPGYLASPTVWVDF